ncbi:hypothetical protein J6590_031741, partial [Homalodisca vitripennis]
LRSSAPLFAEEKNIPRAANTASPAVLGGSSMEKVIFDDGRIVKETGFFRTFAILLEQLLDLCWTRTAWPPVRKGIRHKHHPCCSLFLERERIPCGVDAREGNSDWHRGENSGGGEQAHRLSSRLPPPLHMSSRLLRIVGPRNTRNLSACTISDVHSYDTRGRNNYRTGRHRTVAYERLPSQAGVQFVNKLPNSIKNATMPKAFKTRLKTALISKAFYSTDEFMANDWGTT